jgi:hypothetical protein
MSSRFGVPEHGLRTAIPPVYERRPLAIVGFPRVSSACRPQEV